MCCGMKTPPELRLMLPNQQIMALRSPARRVKEAQNVDVEAQCTRCCLSNIADCENHSHGSQSDGQLKHLLVNASKRDQDVLASRAAMTIAAMAHIPELCTGC